MTMDSFTIVTTIKATYLDCSLPLCDFFHDLQHGLISVIDELHVGLSKSTSGAKLRKDDSLDSEKLSKALLNCTLKSSLGNVGGHAVWGGLHLVN